MRWRLLEERFASASEALDRWERLDALGLEPELLVEGPGGAAVPVARAAVAEGGAEVEGGAGAS